MKVFIGADHNGFEMKAALTEELTRAGYEVIDESGEELVPGDDYPLQTEKVVIAMKAAGQSDARGILICGSGQGVCMAANRYKGIRAALIGSEQEARAARNDDDSNILCLPARFINQKQASKIAHAWLQTPFSGVSRYKRRIKQLDELG